MLSSSLGVHKVSENMLLELDTCTCLLTVNFIEFWKEFATHIKPFSLGFLPITFQYYRLLNANRTTACNEGCSH